MAAFREHVTFSSCLGVGYAGTLWGLGLEWTHGVLAGMLCGLSGMLPDLDSQSGRPVRELFGIAAAIGSIFTIGRLRSAGMTPEESILWAMAVYLVIRFVAAWLLGKISVHRGMFHSLPAALIAAEIIYLTHEECQSENGRLILAGGVLLGFLSHLILDEIYSVDFSGLRVRLKSSAGSALKLFSPSVPATVTAWLLMGMLTYMVCIDRGYVPR